jgi:integrase
MATVIARKRSDGTQAFSCQISIMKEGVVVHRESKTFSDRAMAKAWGERRERALAKPGGLEAAKAGKELLSDAIDKYLATSKKKIGRTKAQVLESIKGMDIANKRCSEITPTDIVSLAQELHDGGRQPSTVMNYISHLQAVFTVAKPAWGFELDPQAMVGAQAVCRRLGLTSKSRQRDRRPTLDELDKLMAHFGTVESRRTGNLPMQRIVAFAIFSTRRQDEITRIAWKDLEPGRVLVRDMKHPGDKIGNDTWCDLVPEAERIIKVMKEVEKEIFPFATDTISASFTRACKFLEIDDLHFHDLRHDGISRLFEMGWNIPHVAAVSGHRSWQSLKRYTHLRHTGDKYANWKWLERITA